MGVELVYYVSEDLKVPLQLPGEFPGWGGERPEPGAEAFQEYIRPLVEAGTALKKGRRIVIPQEVPAVCRLLQRRVPLPGAFRTRDGIQIVQDPVRKIIEDFDPSAHQFLPIEVLQPNKQVHEVPCFIMNVTARQDSIIDELSRVGKYTSKTLSNEEMRVSYLYKDVTVDLSKTTKYHLWREARYPGSLLLSDELWQAFKDADVKFMPSWKTKTKK